jgi:methylmalonyl-CoA/ethylmalonyl-CoA epimerase
MTLPIDHVAIVVRSLDEALAFYRDALGLELSERREVPEEGVEVAFLQLARGRIELVRPLTDEGGVARFLEKRGEGLHHICLVVDNIAETMERLREAGADLVTDEPQVGADGTRYIFIHPKSAHGVLLELYEESL